MKFDYSVNRCKSTPGSQEAYTNNMNIIVLRDGYYVAHTFFFSFYHALLGSREHRLHRNLSHEVQVNRRTWYVETGEAAMNGVMDVCGIMRLVARLYGEE